MLKQKGNVQRAIVNSLTLSATLFSDVSNQSDTHWAFSFGERVLNEFNVRVDIAVEVLIESAGLELGIVAPGDFCSSHQYRDALELSRQMKTCNVKKT
jgi:hypothetical protein